MGDLRFDARRLTQLMLKRGLSDQALATKVGMGRTMIYYLRTGKRDSASAENIAKIAEALGTTTDYLLGKNDDQAQPEPVRQLADIAGRLSGVRQEELLRIAAALEAFEREQPAYSERVQIVEALIEITDKVRVAGGNDDLLESLEALLQNTSPARFGIGSMTTGQGLHKPLEN